MNKNIENLNDFIHKKIQAPKEIYYSGILHRIPVD